MAEDKTVSAIQAMGQGLVAAILGVLGIIAGIWALVSGEPGAPTLAALKLFKGQLPAANVIFLVASAVLAAGGLFLLMGRRVMGHWFCLIGLWAVVVVALLMWLTPSFTFIAAGNIVSVAVAGGMIYWFRGGHRKKKPAADQSPAKPPAASPAAEPRGPESPPDSTP
jgi:hypothetical protein